MDLLENEKGKIVSRRPSCPTEHVRQDYSGSCYSNRVCDINSADVKYFLKKLKIHIVQNYVEAHVIGQEM